jgi:hypothetical protein
MPALGTHLPQEARHRRRSGPDPGHGHDLRTPAEVADRAVPGHWEGDLILGEGGRSAVGTLVERSTRLVLLLHLGRPLRGSVEAAMRKAIATLPAELRRSITWDQGAEMASHAASRPRPGSRSTSAIRTRPGSAARTRTPTACCASTCPRAPTCRSTPLPTSSDPAQPQRPTTQDPRLHDTIRGLRTGRCGHRLNPPLWVANRKVYGAHKLWRAARRPAMRSAGTRSPA